MTWAYYNENNPFCVEWLRNLIKDGHITQGEVDSRSIKDVQLEDLKGFSQHHFFAGIGVWSYALKMVDWPNDIPVFTGSAPCQPFSNAGKRKGFNDERHLWPKFFNLIEQAQPSIVIGEQVASKDALIWFDSVSSDLEGTDYTTAALNIPATSVGSPQIRQRLYWMGITNSTRRNERQQASTSTRQRHTTIPTSDICRLEYTNSTRLERWEEMQCSNQRNSRTTGLVSGYWKDVEWLHCRDDRIRPFKSEFFPLVNGNSGNRVDVLRAIGNALVAPQAIAFAEIVLEIMKEWNYERLTNLSIDSGSH